MRLALTAMIVALAVVASADSASGSPDRPVHGDVTCEGSVNAVDALFDLRTVAGLPPFGDCIAFAGDVNCDGAITAVDALAILRNVAGLSPLPSPEGCPDIGSPIPPSEDTIEPPGADYESEPPGGVGVEISAAAATLCGEPTTHQVEVGWEVTGQIPVSGEPMVQIAVLLTDAESQTSTETGVTGSTTFDLTVPAGGPALVLARVDAPDAIAPETVVLDLDACVPVVVPAEGEGFDRAELPPPPVASAADPNEVDVIHVSGDPDGPGPALLATAAGSGASIKLSSWRVPTGSGPPEHLQDGSPFAGHDVRLHALRTTGLPPAGRPFVSGSIHDDTLWLATWQAASDGTLTKLDSVSYKPDAGVLVEAFDIAHRPLNGDFQVVTPVRVTIPTPTSPTIGLRLVTWSVDPADGSITGKFDSGTWGWPATDTQLSAAHIDGEVYVVAFRDAAGDQSNHFWSVDDLGEPVYRWGGSSGQTPYGPVTQPIKAVDVQPLTSSGFITAIQDDNDQFRVTSWEQRAVACGGGLIEVGCVYSPWRVAINTEDTDQTTKGVQLPDPATNAKREIVVEEGWERELGPGAGQLFLRMPGDEFPAAAIGSVAKVMTLHLALAAVDNGSIGLFDLVEVTEYALQQNKPCGYQAGQEYPFIHLLYCLILKSSGAAGRAIIEGLYGQGEYADLIINNPNSPLNDLAVGLNMSDTLYCSALGATWSTPSDQIKLWLEAAEAHPLFLEITGATSYTLDGYPPISAPRAGDSGAVYPGPGLANGIDGWKGGGAKTNFGVGYKEIPPLGFFLDCTVNAKFDDDSPEKKQGRCASCLVAQATRLGRTVVIEFQYDGTGQSFSRWPNATALWEFGFKKLFIPDFRGDSGAQGGAANDFGLDAVSDSLAVTAAIDALGDIDVCRWDVFAPLGQASLSGCASQSIDDLPGGGVPAPPTVVDMVLLSTLEAEGDYLIARTPGANLQLELWRVAPKDPP